jgi:hypothetical protein
MLSFLDEMVCKYISNRDTSVDVFADLASQVRQEYSYPAEATRNVITSITGTCHDHDTADFFCTKFETLAVELDLIWCIAATEMRERMADLQQRKELDYHRHIL